jgi:hypothetical protein
MSLGRFFRKQIAPKSFRRYFAEKKYPTPKIIAQMAKFRPI